MNISITINQLRKFQLRIGKELKLSKIDSVKEYTVENSSNKNISIAN